MGRLKSFEKRKAREREKTRLGVRIPLICAGEDCEAQTELGLFEPAPFAAGLLRQAGWSTLSSDSDGIVRFYCPECKGVALIERDIEEDYP
jgi:hypothetical protein